MTYEFDNLLRTDFLAFALKAFATLNRGKPYVIYQFLKLLAYVLRSVADGKIKRLIITIPPRHSKTFLGSICLPAWILARNPSAKILLISYGQDLADKNAYAIRAILQCDWFKRVYKTRIAKDRTLLMDFLTTAGGGVRSVSIEGGVTGFGADYIIVDDPLQIKDWDNVRQQEHVIELFDSETRTRLDRPNQGSIVVIAHRLSEGDLPGHLLKEGGWKLLKLPLIAPRARDYNIGDGAIWHRKKGELLRPDAFTRRDIERLRGLMHPGFETLQQQNPGKLDYLRIKAEHFLTFSPWALPRNLPVVLSIDPGQKGGPTNSFSVIQAWTVHEGTHFLLEQWRERALFSEFRAAVRTLVRKHCPSVVLIEDTGQGPALRCDIGRQTGMAVVMITPFGSKPDRLRQHRHTIRSGRVYLPDSALWRNDFLEEVTLFPYAPHDDQVDAMSQYLNWIAEHPNTASRPPRMIASLAKANRLGSISTWSAPGKMPGPVLIPRCFVKGR
jgi:predicted phage terminase large subunit-like protein